MSELTTLGRPTIDVAVLGAGPAGAAAALGLQCLGHSVAVVGRPRNTHMEGLSHRTVSRLVAARLLAAAQHVGDPSPRIGVWAGVNAVRGTEFLVERAQLDMALSRDLANGGLTVLDRSVLGVVPEATGWRVDTDRGPLHCRAVVEARGRRARGCERSGPRLVAWLERWHTERNRPRGSAVVALDDGWCWLAADGAGRLQRQFICSPRSCMTSAALRERFAIAAGAVPELDFSTSNAEPIDRLQAKAAVMRFSRPAPLPGLVRIGDAALALDPLSGQGVHEALGSARVGVAAINSFLAGSEWAPIARFVDERAAELWRRGVETAGHFYRLHAGSVRATPFWDATASACERLAAEAAAALTGPQPGRFEARPVLNGERIEVRSVWVSARWPRGLWRVARRDVPEGRQADQAVGDFMRGSQ